MNETWFGIEVTRDEQRWRLEDLLLDRFRRLSKLYIREVIKSGKCEVNGSLENRGHRLKWKDFVEVRLDPTRENSMLPQDIPLEIIFEDEHFIVVNKPIGMLVHPSHRDKTGTILNAMAFYLNRDTQKHMRPGLVHRLDKETSGILVIAKHNRSHQRLAIQFERKSVEKNYLALVEGIVASDHGSIVDPIGRFVEEKRWGIKADGRNAETRFWVRKRNQDTTVLELEPVTGRTNQLRIHCESIGHPIVGDAARGGRDHERLCLHAHKLTLRHPESRAVMTFQSEIEF